MKRILLLTAACFAFAAFANADVNRAHLTPVKHKTRHQHEKHHAHRAAKHHAQHGRHHSV